MAAVKANAYGHGLVPVARALSAADALGVARIQEAQTLRSAGAVLPIVALEGVFSAEQLAIAARDNVEPVVHTFEQVAMLEEFSGLLPSRVWLKVDTGMGRLGFRIEEFSSAWERLRRVRSIGGIGLMTHLAEAEVVGGAATCQQLFRFEQLSRGQAIERSVANSAALIAWPDARMDWVRPGIMLYGVSPFSTRTGGELGLRPALKLSTQIIAVRVVRAGEAIGYNGIWRASRESRIAVAAIGYGDGYPRLIGEATPVVINGNEAPVVGRVSMDMTLIDVTELPVAVGDEVTMWGGALPVERIASCASTIAYELLCGITERVTRSWR
jgi:alanine racemase